MNLRLTIPFLAALAAIVSCDKGLESDGPSGPAVSGQSFRAVTEVPVPAGSTKAFDPAVKAFRFEIGDEIAVSDGTVTSIFVATSLTDSDVSFTLKAGETALADEGVTYKAYYPASIAPGLSGVAGQPGCYMMQQQDNGFGAVSATKPESANDANYSEAAFKANPMVAESSTKDLQFKNLCALIRVDIKLPDESDRALRSVTLETEGNAVSGPFVVDESGAMVCTGNADSNSTAVSYCKNARYVSAAPVYYIAVPAGTYDKVKFTVLDNKNNTQIYTMKLGSELVVERNKIYTKTLLLDDMSVDLSANGTANTYVTTPTEGARWRFLASRAGETTPVPGMASVKLLWRTYTTTTTPGDGKVVKNEVAYENGYVKFTTTSTNGDVLLGAYDSSDNLIWTWLIWSPSEAIKDTEYPNGKIVMDRNIGGMKAEYSYSSSKYSSMHSAGLLYQWGRPLPFPGKGNMGGNRSTINGVGAAALSTSISATAPVALEDALKDYLTTFVGTEADAVWTEDTRPDWSGDIKTAYDPCPPGYRVPDDKLWSGIPAGATWINGPNYSATQMVGYYYSYEDKNFAFYPTNGVIKFDGSYKYTAATSCCNLWHRTVTDGFTGYYAINGKDPNADPAINVSMGTVPVRSCEARSVRCERIQ